MDPKTVKQTISFFQASIKTACIEEAAGEVPDGDVRLTANIRQDLHLRLKIEAATRRITIGELVEELISKNVRRR